MNFRPRPFAIRLHRYAGLLLAAFLIVSGVTGSLLAFHAEIDRWLNPQWFNATSTDKQLPLSSVVVAVEARYPDAYVNRIKLPQAARDSLKLFLEPRLSSQTGAALEVNRLYIDPGSGELLGARHWGSLRFDRAHFVPFVYELHHRLHLGKLGSWLLGVVAIMWALDCFIGLYLAWPRPTWTALKRAFGIKRRAGGYRRQYDVHRAGGLWFWLVLLTLAVSGVYLNLGQEVFRPALSLFTELTAQPTDRIPQRHDVEKPPRIDWDQAAAKAANALPDAAVARLGEIRYAPLKRIYRIGFYSTDDISASYPGLLVYVGAESGRVLAVQPPNSGSAGDLIVQWQFPLHSGQAFGLPGRVLVSISGLLVIALTVTGLVIWSRKRLARFSTMVSGPGRTFQPRVKRETS